MPKTKPVPLDIGTIEFESGFLSISCPLAYQAKFQKIRDLLNFLAEMPEQNRLLNYKFFLAVTIDAHARDHAHGTLGRRAIFETKNRLFLSIVNSPARRLIGFRFLRSKNFKVIAYCTECEKKNAGINPDEPHKKIFCQNCTIDKHFYDLLEITHFFEKGFSKLALSNDRVPQIKGFKRSMVKSKPFVERTDEILYDSRHYWGRELRGLSLASCLQTAERLMQETENADTRTRSEQISLAEKEFQSPTLTSQVTTHSPRKGPSPTRRNPNC